MDNEFVSIWEDVLRKKGRAFFFRKGHEMHKINNLNSKSQTN